MRVLCHIPNASTEISGVKFASAGGLMVSKDISEERAARFLSINGFTEAPVIAPNIGRMQDQDDAGAQMPISDVEPASQEPADETETDDAGDDDETEDLDTDDDEDVETDDAPKEPTTTRVPARKSGAKKKKR